MLNFLRKLRRNNMNGKYLKYALGEIILVVIGILIALSINNWNQKRLDNKKELSHLQNLKADLLQNVKILENIDSLYLNLQRNTEKAIQLFTQNPKATDIPRIDSLGQTFYTTFRVNRSTYDEMLNDGSFYNIKNKDLRSQISNLYVEADNEAEAFVEINREIVSIYRSESMNKYKALSLKRTIPDLELNFRDTAWLKDHDSKPFLAVLAYLVSVQGNSNTARRSIIARHLLRCNELLKALEDELENRTS